MVIDWKVLTPAMQTIGPTIGYITERNVRNEKLISQLQITAT